MILTAAIALFVLIFAAIAFAKYDRFLYNGIDLAYFSQVFWNSLHGHFFAQSIHPHLSLGDHLELAIPFLLPFYAIWPDPRMLIILQALALAACAWPVYLLAKTRLKRGPIMPLLLAIGVLLHPSLQHISLYEFHILPFALLPLLLAMLAYERGQFWRFLACIAAAMLVREDVALVVVMIGVLAWIEGKPWKWRLWPILFGGAYFFLALKVIGLFAPAGHYKFLVYYSWLGDSPLHILLGIVRHPLVIAKHIMTPGNVEMLLAFLIPLAFLPLLAPRRLILALGPLAQILLGAPGGGSIVSSTHYATLFLPALFLAAIDGTAALPKIKNAVQSIGIDDARRATAAAIAVTVLYGSLTIGPLVPGVCMLLHFLRCPGMPIDMRNDVARAEDAKKILAEIQADASVAASYALLPRLSSRGNLYSLHYLFLGVTQFAESPYPTPSVVYAAFDADDVKTYRTQFLNTAWAKPHYDGGFDRLEKAIGAPQKKYGDFFLYQKDARSAGIPQPWSGQISSSPPQAVLTLDALGTVRRTPSPFP